GAVVCPVLIVHSRDDEIIPVSHGRALFEAAPEPKAFLELSGGHNDGFLVSGRTYTDGLDAFLAKHLDEQAP
ncbi:MAG: alpha/beta hydrolase, partial [Rhodospirillales bacterium]|nr:alpha/beta hydrolase [Rhodospirillales bacterium]